ncbi:RAB6-interacting golgin [Caenorhabditis elegans]|uniref:RAB6-interacting golgin n=1 Tax=Caenorhabditis elegans TaxID=6239 RepID=Q18521_CAEEL|nr:RAB6-interacting golgin [Caenorhabditis elegans]CAA90335.2 RAB6-interacting golgin [Caenorhabditis elegans]|eukprot:NP_509750.2 Uncharacterized protein CELE_C39B10.3 [Caenorhabditis elegans]
MNENEEYQQLLETKRLQDLDLQHHRAEIRRNTDVIQSMEERVARQEEMLTFLVDASKKYDEELEEKRDENKKATKEYEELEKVAANLKEIMNPGAFMTEHGSLATCSSATEVKNISQTTPQTVNKKTVTRGHKNNRTGKETIGTKQTNSVETS